VATCPHEKLRPAASSKLALPFADHAREAQNSVHRPAVDARSVPKTLAVGRIVPKTLAVGGGTPSLIARHAGLLHT